MLAIAMLLVGPAIGAAPAKSLPPDVLRSSQGYSAQIAIASRRFGVPEVWICAVLHAESRGRMRSVSPAGAMGLMQIMPGTWQELRDRYGLGADPFAPGDNILAGAAYLGELHARFGAPGFLAAYNAGPARYAEHLTQGRPLPAETIAYVAAIAPWLGMKALQDNAAHVSRSNIDPARAPLFVMRHRRKETAGSMISGGPPAGASFWSSGAGDGLGHGLFVVRAPASGER